MLFSPYCREFNSVQKRYTALCIGPILFQKIKNTVGGWRKVDGQIFAGTRSEKPKIFAGTKLQFQNFLFGTKLQFPKILFGSQRGNTSSNTNNNNNSGILMERNHKTVCKRQNSTYEHNEI